MWPKEIKTVPLANLVVGQIFDKRFLITPMEDVAEGVGKLNYEVGKQILEGKGYTLLINPMTHEQVETNKNSSPMTPGQMLPHLRAMQGGWGGAVMGCQFGIVANDSDRVLIVPTLILGELGANQNSTMLFDLVIRKLCGKFATEVNRGFVTE